MSASFSPDRAHRYALTRAWGHGPQVTFVLLNPSTADESSDDPTIRRCIRFARDWGYAGLELVNLYAFRATKPKDLWKAVDPIGPENDLHLAEAARRSEILVAAWGSNAKQARVDEVLSLPGFDNLTCLHVTKRGHPGHPLYLRSELQPRPWPPS